MALRQFADVPLTTMVEAPAAGPGLTLVVGAGISVEAGLPPWRQLVHDLLDRAARERLDLADSRIRANWIDQMLQGESPLGAAAIVEALAGDDLAAWIPHALYGQDPGRFQPGPIARQVPVLRQAFGTGLRLLTTNYDDLLHQALEEAAIGVAAAVFTGPEGFSTPATDAANQRISHLHGFFARDGRRQGSVVLTEHDYQRVAQADWQRSEVGSALMNSTCIFIGSSLTDPNLLRYLHMHSGPGSPQHFAIFTRQDVYPKGTPQEVVAAREAALAARRSLALEQPRDRVRRPLRRNRARARRGGTRQAPGKRLCPAPTTAPRVACKGRRAAPAAAGRWRVHPGAGSAAPSFAHCIGGRCGDRERPWIQHPRRGSRRVAVARRRGWRHAHQLGDNRSRSS